MAMETSEILFTRQRHEAERAGLHYDIRLVHGDVAYSWATKKEMPKPGEAIILHEQPVHDTAYALSQKVVIPKGQYGAGVTTLDFVRKATMVKRDDHFVIFTKDGERYLLKKIPSYGEKQWFFKNLTGIYTKPAVELEGHLKSSVDGLIKKALLLEQWQHDETGRKTWMKNGDNPGKGWNKTGAKTYKKKGWTKKASFSLMEKIAKKIEDKSTELRPHHIKALAKLDKQEGLLVDHSMGSGKTLLYLKAIEKFQKKNPKEDALVIAPASLVTNIDKEIIKHKVNIDRSRLETISYEKAALNSEKLKKNKYGMVVADEAHKLRNTGTLRHKELSELITKAHKRLLGTGTTTYNHPSDIAPLVNLAAGRHVLPEGRQAFEQAFIEKRIEQPPLLKRILGHPPVEKHVLKNSKSLKKILQKHIDHYDLADDPSAKDKFPEKIEKIIEVPMSAEQHSLYKYMEGRLPWHLKLKVRMNMPLDKRDTATLQSFSSGVRQVSNSVQSYMPLYEKASPKIRAAVDSLQASHKKDKRFRGLVYSHYLDSGLNEYSKELTRRKIAHKIYHGGLSREEKDALTEEFNKGKNKVLLVSSSGTEGLNLKGVKKEQILEPHFNKSKIDQVVARGVRYESHEHLPKQERKVEIEHYHSVFPKRRFNFGPKQYSIDQYLHHNAKTKSEVGEKMKELVKQATASKSEPHFERGHHEFERAKYKETDDWQKIDDPVASLKYDGAAFFMLIDEDGKPKFLSRRPSIRGGFPDRTANIPHLANLRFPEFAGNTYHVELIHTGKEFQPEEEGRHAILSGILNSKAERAVRTQAVAGPVRAVLLDVMHPKLPTFGDKLANMMKLRESVGNPDFLITPDLKIGHDAVKQLIETTRSQGREGVVITSLTTPEEKNVRFKVKHFGTYNLLVADMLEEINILGKPKNSMGALVLRDSSGRIVGKVGTGFTREMRDWFWNHKDEVLGKALVQVKAMPSTAHRLRHPIYNGFADGNLDTI